MGRVSNIYPQKQLNQNNIKLKQHYGQNRESCGNQYKSIRKVRMKKKTCPNLIENLAKSPKWPIDSQAHFPTQILGSGLS